MPRMISLITDYDRFDHALNLRYEVPAHPTPAPKEAGRVDAFSISNTEYPTEQAQPSPPPRSRSRYCRGEMPNSRRYRSPSSRCQL